MELPWFYFLARNSQINNDACTGALSWWSIHFSPLMNQAFFLWLPLVIFSVLPNNIPYWLSIHEVQMYDRQLPHIRKKWSTWIWRSIELGALFSVWEVFLTPLERTGIWSEHRTHKRTSRYTLQYFLEVVITVSLIQEFLTVGNTLFFLFVS
jgi:hypothetical protein